MTSRNLNYQQDGLDRAENALSALEAVQTLIGIADDMHTVAQDELGSLLDILNRELAIGLRDLRTERKQFMSPTASHLKPGAH